MWMCYSCDRHFRYFFRLNGEVLCPYCGSSDITEIEKGSSLANQKPYPYQVKSEVDTLGYGAMSSVQKDGFIMNGLKKCGVDCPTMFSLLWGDDMANGVAFPVALRKLVTDIIQETERKEESYDLTEKRLHSIIIDLLHVMYEKQVNDIVKRAKEKVRYYK